MSFAWNLKTLRTEAGFTQVELAKKIGVNQKTLSSWETGRTEPTVGDCIKICKVLDCPLEKLTDTRMRDIGDITLEDILVKLPKLSMDELEKIHDTADEIMEHEKQLALLELHRREQLERISTYEREIAKLKKQLAEGKF